MALFVEVGIVKNDILATNDESHNARLLASVMNKISQQLNVRMLLNVLM